MFCAASACDRFALARREKDFQLLEQLRLAVRRAFLLQPFDDLGQQRQRPFAVERLVRTRLVRGGDLKLRVRRLPVERERRLAAAALLTLRLVPFVGQKMFQRRQQEGAEPSAFGAQAVEIILGEEAREKRLRQILGVLLRVAAAADVGVERKPVSAAQLLQRQIGLRRRTFARREHDRPMRRGEDVARRVECPLECSEVNSVQLSRTLNVSKYGIAGRFCLSWKPWNFWLLIHQP